MMGFWGTAILLIALATAVIMIVRTSLNNRALSRDLRAIFICQVEKMIVDPRLPEGHARLLLAMVDLPECLTTRNYVLSLFGRIIVSETPRPAISPRIEELPVQLRKQYVLAMLSFALADSYRCVVLGRIFRAANNWVLAAVEKPKPDVNAHATKVIVQNVTYASTDRHKAKDEELMVA